MGQMNWWRARAPIASLTLDPDRTWVLVETLPDAQVNRGLFGWWCQMAGESRGVAWRGATASWAGPR